MGLSSGAALAVLALHSYLVIPVWLAPVVMNSVVLGVSTDTCADAWSEHRNSELCTRLYEYILGLTVIWATIGFSHASTLCLSYDYECRELARSFIFCGIGSTLCGAAAILIYSVVVAVWLGRSERLVVEVPTRSPLFVGAIVNVALTLLLALALTIAFVAYAVRETGCCDRVRREEFVRSVAQIEATAAAMEATIDTNKPITAIGPAPAQ